MKQHYTVLNLQERNMWMSPPLVDQVHSNTPLRLHTIEMIPTMYLAHVFLVSYYE